MLVLTRAGFRAGRAAEAGAGRRVAGSVAVGISRAGRQECKRAVVSGRASSARAREPEPGELGQYQGRSHSSQVWHRHH